MIEKIKNKIAGALSWKRSAALLLMALLASAAVSGAQSTGLVPKSGIAILQYTLPILPGSWVGVAALVILIVIAFAVIVYMLAGLIDSPNARGWARFQIYEAILSIIFILIFLFFVFIFFLNPQPVLSAIGLLPTATVYTGEFDCSQAFDIFTLATCDISEFNHFTYGVFEGIYEVTVYMGVTTGVSITSTLKDGSTVASASGSLGSFIPIPAEVMFATVFSSILILFVLLQVQVLLISGSLLWLAFFVSLGVIARSFGFSRTFGGAMIAMGIGLGIIYPLMTIMTYGFVNTQLSMANVNGSSSITGSAIITSLITSTVEAIFYQAPPAGSWIFPLAMAIAGLTFIPFLNFTIVDAFIVDFSKSIGERVDFMSLLINVI